MELLYKANLNPTLSLKDKKQLLEVLVKHHSVFSLEEGERGETSLVEFAINTGDSAPRKQVVRRIPYAARQEITRQLMKKE